MSCNSPLLIEHSGTFYQVPCRWCLGCRIDRRNLWEMRLRFEVFENYKLGFGSSFVTLTYDDEHCDFELHKKDIQDFLKRLRYYLSKDNSISCNKKFKYYAVGEYGSITNRCHYHIVFTGLSKEFLSKYCREVWKNGMTKVDACTNGRIRYTLKYMDKQVFDTDKITITLPDYTEKEVTAPFSIFSKGIGVKYLQDSLKDIDENGLINNGGRFIPYPKYYAKKFGIDTEIWKVEQINRLKVSAHRNKMIVSEYVNNLAVLKETKNVHSARLGDNAVDDSHIFQAKARIKTDSEVYKDIVKEILNEK